MDNKDARRTALSEWFMEFSVLWAVFPLLDQFVEDKPFDVSVTAGSLGTSLTAAAIGVILRKAERE